MLVVVGICMCVFVCCHSSALTILVSTQLYSELNARPIKVEGSSWTLRFLLTAIVKL